VETLAIAIVIALDTTALGVSVGAEIISWLGCAVGAGLVAIPGLTTGPGDVAIAGAGCGVGYLAGNEIASSSSIGKWENSLSFLSLGAATIADLYGDRTGYDPLTGSYVLGGDTVVAGTGALGGLILFTAIDLAINIDLVVYDFTRAAGLFPDTEIGITPGKEIYLDLGVKRHSVPIP
jgi:hypothetical protein